MKRKKPHTEVTWAVLRPDGGFGSTGDRDYLRWLSNGVTGARVVRVRITQIPAPSRRKSGRKSK